ncbi:MAG TPA: hypothetical protein VMO81_10790 [Aestuariivirgaceae bacterium]|nr:hypothetical protein [Aestuariivirgaceae bacterium]
MDHETLSLALALTVAGFNGRYSAAQWRKAAVTTEIAVKALRDR